MNRLMIIAALAVSAGFYSCDDTVSSAGAGTKSVVGEWAVDTMWVQMVGVTTTGDTTYKQFINLDSANNGVVRFQADGMLVFEHPDRSDTSSWTQSGATVRVVESGNGKVTTYSAMLSDSALELVSQTDTVYGVGTNQMNLRTKSTLKAHRATIAP